jgi:tetratricopeptide (TPR) repeat protein
MAAPADSLAERVGRAAPVLWLSLIALALSRAITAYTPSMWLWGFNVRRFLGPGHDWLNWLDVAVGVVLPLAALLVPIATVLGNSIVRLPAISSLVAATLLASLAWLLPDRLLFTGDFLMRQGTVTQGKTAAELFPQALPLDVLLHVELPSFLVAHGGLSANGAGRLIGVLEVAVLALLALVFVRALALRGTAALAAALTVICGGYLGLFTGYGKSFAELCLVTVAVGAFGVRAVREGGGLLPLSLAVSAGIALHRSGLAFLPVLPVVWTLWWNRHGRDGAWRRPATLAAFAMPFATLAVLAPRILAAMRVRDAAHFLPADARSSGILHAAFSGTRALDLANLAALLSPLAPAIPLVALGFGAPLLRRREGWVLGALALPLVGMMPFVHPAQGVFRDWDVFAASGVALSLIAAWLVGEVVRSPRRGALGVAVMVGVALPSVQWLAHLSDFERGAERVRAFVTETPQRTEDERATTWEFLGNRSFARKRWEDASLAYRNAAEQSPNPRLFAQWGMAEAMQGHYREAQGLYARAVERNPDFTLAWLGLATSSTWLDDTATCARATRAIQQLNPDHEQLPALYTYLESMRHPQSVR